MIENIFHVLVNDTGRLPGELPPIARKCLTEVKALHPGAKQLLIDDAAIRQFLAAEFDSDVTAAYESLQPYAYKADLARYCLLYARGGLYSDLTNLFVRPLPVGDGSRPVLLRCPGEEGLRLHTTILYAPAHCPVLKAAIDAVVRNCRRHYYGANPLCPTGPQMMGETVARLDSSGVLFGEARYVSPNYRNGVCLDPEGNLFALRMKGEGGDLVHSGFTGTNDYNDFWHERRVYGEVEKVWAWDDPLLCCAGATRGDGCIILVPGAYGCQTFGPYVRLMPGRYDALLSFRPATLDGELTADITADFGATQLAAFTIDTLEMRDRGMVHLPFQLDAPAEKVEVRLFSDGTATGALHQLMVRAAD